MNPFQDIKDTAHSEYMEGWLAGRVWVQTNLKKWSPFLQDQSPLTLSQVTLTEHTEHASAASGNAQVKPCLCEKAHTAYWIHVHQTSARVFN